MRRKTKKLVRKIRTKEETEEALRKLEAKRQIKEQLKREKASKTFMHFYKLPKYAPILEGDYNTMTNKNKEEFRHKLKKYVDRVYDLNREYLDSVIDESKFKYNLLEQRFYKRLEYGKFTDAEEITQVLLRSRDISAKNNTMRNGKKGPSFYVFRENLVSALKKYGAMQPLNRALKEFDNGHQFRIDNLNYDSNDGTYVYTMTNGENIYIEITDSPVSINIYFRNELIFTNI